MKKKTITVVALLSALAITGCTKKVLVPVEVSNPVVLHDTLMTTKYTADTVYRRDSIYLQGETMIKDRVVYRSRTVHDTVYRTRGDTVVVERLVNLPGNKIEDAKRLPWYDLAAMRLGKIVASFALLALVGFIIYCFVKYRKKNNFWLCC